MLVNRFHILLLGILAVLASCSTSRHEARIVLLPDTQTYAEKYPEILDSQINWIQRNARQISFVLQQGDLTQNNNQKEWGIVQQAFYRLNNKVPYVLAAGNHDMGSAEGKFADVRNTSLFNQFFSEATLSGLPGFGGIAEAGKTENAFYTFVIGRVKWLVLTLEFGPRNKILDWANQVIVKHPNHVVIVNTHSYLYSDSTRQGVGDHWRPQAYGVGKDTGTAAVNDGEQIWRKLVKQHAAVRFVFSGHILNSGVGTLISSNDAGYPVYQLLANYQEGVRGSVKGGNGWLRIIDFDFKKKTMKVTTFSPYLNRYMDDPQHNFLLKQVPFK